MTADSGVPLRASAPYALGGRAMAASPRRITRSRSGARSGQVCVLGVLTRSGSRVRYMMTAAWRSIGA